MAKTYLKYFIIGLFATFDLYLFTSEFPTYNWAAGFVDGMIEEMPLVISRILAFVLAPLIFGVLYITKKLFVDRHNSKLYFVLFCICILVISNYYYGILFYE